MSLSPEGMAVVRVQVTVPLVHIQSEPVPPPLLPVSLMETAVIPDGRVSARVSVPAVEPGPLFETAIV